ncbi:siderophore-interacting protein [Angustibacter sp. McL0619]|uniref:siderophore-interacting protein n=1 Tax=Angustibacter sp. McL0619 TaxID=3415676 RepID=UPI003CEAB8E2
MTETPRRPRTTHHGDVLRTERLSPHLVRVVLGGSGLVAFDTGGYTDHYVKLLFANPSAPDVDLSDVAALRERLPREHWPVTRTYTVRAWDRASLELTLDFVVHGDEGLAGPWAANAQRGDRLWFSGPGGGYTPDPDADWHLLAGDESALPAIAAALEELDDRAVGTAFIEVPDQADVLPLTAPAGVDVVWLHREDRRVGELLVDQVRAAAFRPGHPQVFVHGEATFVKELRTHLRVERELPRGRQSISGYWRLGLNEDGWQSSKSTWNEAADREEQQALARAQG